jgi:glycine/D-amino acid oxidase-like deaminating enzyme
MSFDRRSFLKATASGAGVTMFGVAIGADQELHSPVASGSPKREFSNTRPDIAVIGAGAFGMWTALYLNRLGANVTVVDLYGPGNSRSTSGGQTRGVKSSYGSSRHGLQWAAWAQEAIQRWQRWDAEWRDNLHPRIFFNSGDLVLRKSMSQSLKNSVTNWESLGVPFEVLTADEVGYRFPVLNVDDFEAALFEPNAGIVRSRRAIEAVASVFSSEGGAIRVARATMGKHGDSVLSELKLSSGETVSAKSYVFACGPWLPKVFPELMKKKLSTPMGHVYYFGTPPGDDRFTFPNFPSFNFAGATGWPALNRDYRGFRIRTGGTLFQDPDLSDRTIDPRHHANARRFLTRYFKDLADAPVLETRACHYEYSTDFNFIIDTHPDFDNVWIAGGGSAEGFKFGPVAGEYIAKRVLNLETDSQLAASFMLKPDEFGDLPLKQNNPGWLTRKINDFCDDRDD